MVQRREKRLRQRAVERALSKLRHVGQLGYPLHPFPVISCSLDGPRKIDGRTDHLHHYETREMQKTLACGSYFLHFASVLKCPLRFITV